MNKPVPKWAQTAADTSCWFYYLAAIFTFGHAYQHYAAEYESQGMIIRTLVALVAALFHPLYWSTWLATP